MLGQLLLLWRETGLELLAQLLGDGVGFLFGVEVGEGGGRDGELLWLDGEGLWLLSGGWSGEGLLGDLWYKRRKLIDIAFVLYELDEFVLY